MKKASTDIVQGRSDDSRRTKQFKAEIQSEF